MKKTISFELSKRLNELWLLDNIETKYVINIETKELLTNDYVNFPSIYDTKTLTLQEAIEFLPYRIKNNQNFYLLHFRKTEVFWVNQFNIDYYKWDNYNIWLFYWEINWETLLESVEKMITYLLDNNLINGNERKDSN